MDQMIEFYESVTHGVDTFELGLGPSSEYEPGIYFSNVRTLGSDGCQFGDFGPLDDMRDDFTLQNHRSKTEEQLRAELDQYEHTIAVIPQECVGPPRTPGWASTGSINRDGELVAQRVVVVSDAYIVNRNDNLLGIRIFGHEIGHNMSLRHAQAYDCHNNFLPQLQGCDFVDGDQGRSIYGNYNDIMGSGTDTWFMTPTMRRLSWLPTGQVETPPGAGTWEYELTPMDSGQLNG